ncbi:MAG TPA: peptidoglycan DD-metalloendopeptidase family protein [Clostridiaceae bacterium]|jgi:murein DD-endopeptidase MepM/ murein hydrolase activator NlpD|nr:peptidoglycan DD-metalloendopeptidase family protein [Clostridiaceae bacterium]
MNRKKAISVVLAMIFLLAWTLPVLADELSKAKQDKEKIDNQINNIEQQKKQEISTGKKLEQDKNKILNTEKQENQEYQELLNEIEELNKTMSEIDKAIEEAEQNYEHQCELFQSRLRAMYKNSNETTLDILLQSKSITDFLERLELISCISKRDKQIVEDLNLAKQEVEYKRKLKLTEKIETQKKAEEKKDRLDSLISSRSDLESQILQSKNRIATLEKQEKELLQKSKEMSNLIVTLSRRAKYVEGQMIWPLQYTTLITSRFGNRRHPILRKYTMHTGVDIGGKSGESILAANKGTVIIAGWQNAYGNTVVIDHGGGITTLYAHCSKILVKSGQEVKVGQVIAKVGSTGWSTGPHLHFEVRENGEPQNPLDYVKP